MADDIVERLRAKDAVTSVMKSCWAVTGRHPGELNDLMKEAADEIERLRLELDMTQATIRVPSQKDDVRTIERLREELVSALDEAARLREAFGLISTLAPHMEVDVNDYIGMAQKICADNERLREALKPFADLRKTQTAMSNGALDDYAINANIPCGSLRAAKAALEEK